jgi:hypothetical protein
MDISQRMLVHRGMSSRQARLHLVRPSVAAMKIELSERCVGGLSGKADPGSRRTLSGLVNEMPADRG